MKKPPVRQTKPLPSSNGRQTGSSWLNAAVSWYEGVEAQKGKRGEKRLDEVLEIINTRPIKTESRIRQLYQQRQNLAEGTPEYGRVSEEYKRLKERLFGFTPSGVCPNGRDDKGLVSYNANVLLDFDKLPDEAERERIFQLLIREPYILCVWRSISGFGVKALAVWKYPDRPADKTGHRYAFSVFQKRMFKLTGRGIDSACQNESRFCFVAHDPDLRINRNGFEPLVIEPRAKQAQPEPEPKPLSQNKRARLQAWVEGDGRVGAVKLEMRNGQPVVECERCPSGRQHKDVMIFLNEIPYLHCFHPESCAQAVADYNEQLRAVWTEMFYEDARKQYWIREKANPDKWMTVNDSRAKAALRALGVLKKSCDDWLYYICVWNNVRYAAPLAGYQSGIHESFNEKILVTRSPKILEPKHGSWPVLRKFLQGLLDEEQLPVFMGWVLVAYEALRSGEPRHGQALGLVGPAKAGKSLLQKIITVILGGRVKHPFKYMTGRTDFNAELFEAEHLCIDDEKASIDIRSRRELGTAIKMVCVNQDQTCFRKYATPVTLLPFWRLTISVNDDPEALQVLPPLDEDIADKLILLKTAKRPMPMPTRSGPERKRFWDRLVDELPTFLHFLTNEWSIPAKLLKSEWAERYGIDSWKHPDVVRLLTELSPEWHLLELLDQAYFPRTDEAGQTLFYKDPIHANHRVIEHRLRQTHTNVVIDRFLAGPQTLVKYLGRLAKNPATEARVRKPTNHTSREWEIEPPADKPEPRPEDAF